MPLDSESRWRLARKAKAQPPVEPAPLIYRDAVETDMVQVLEIYNYYIKNSVVTFDLDPMTIAAWLEKYRWIKGLNLPFIVVEGSDQQILGFAYVAPWRAKAAYKRTVEDSIYLRPAATGKRIGTTLLEKLIDACKAAGVREIVAVISDKGAEPSVKIHENAGFKHQGHLGKVGFKFNRWLGVTLLQRSLK